ncbi:MAG: hypothetical protein Q8K93_04510, partial [Reyranella sp.]|nr:hypothetical protein [Reyranella sp.]
MAGRRTEIRASDLGSDLGSDGFLVAGFATRRGGLRALADLAFAGAFARLAFADLLGGRLPLPAPFLDLPLAMLASRWCSCQFGNPSASTGQATETAEETMAV